MRLILSSITYISQQSWSYPKFRQINFPRWLIVSKPSSPDELFIYALITMVIAMTIFSFFKENKNAKIKIKQGMEKFEDND